MPRTSLILWFLGREMDIRELDNYLETSMGVVFPEIYRCVQSLRSRRTEKSNVRLHDFPMSTFAPVHNILVIDAMESACRLFQRRKCHVPQWNCTCDQLLHKRIEASVFLWVQVVDVACDPNMRSKTVVEPNEIWTDSFENTYFTLFSSPDISMSQGSH